MANKFYSAYNPPIVDGINFTDESQTQQHFKDECDVNKIMDRYLKTGVLVDPLRPATVHPMFGDFSADVSFHAAQNFVVEACQQFDALPAKVRARFHNDPAELLAFLDDEANRDEALKLGLILPPVDDTATTVSAGEAASGKGQDPADG